MTRKGTMKFIVEGNVKGVTGLVKHTALKTSHSCISLAPGSETLAHDWRQALTPLL